MNTKKYTAEYCIANNYIIVCGSVSSAIRIGTILMSSGGLFYKYDDQYKTGFFIDLFNDKYYAEKCFAFKITNTLNVNGTGYFEIVAIQSNQEKLIYADDFIKDNTETFEMPTKFCIERNDQNGYTINTWLNNQRPMHKYTNRSMYVHFPSSEGSTVWSTPHYGYKVITFDEFVIYFMHLNKKDIWTLTHPLINNNNENKLRMYDIQELQELGTKIMVECNGYGQASQLGNFHQNYTTNGRCYVQFHKNPGVSWKSTSVCHSWSHKQNRGVIKFEQVIIPGGLETKGGNYKLLKTIDTPTHSIKAGIVKSRLYWLSNNIATEKSLNNTFWFKNVEEQFYIDEQDKNHKISFASDGKGIYINNIFYSDEQIKNIINVLLMTNVKSLNVGCHGQFKIDLVLLYKIQDRIKEKQKISQAAKLQKEEQYFINNFL